MSTLPIVTVPACLHTRRWRILAVILCVEIMDMMDGMIVNIAAPAIHRDLHAGLSALQWIAGGYALAFSIGLVTSGRLGDIYGRRRLFLLGVAGFTLSSLLCGVAVSSGMLIAFRLLQGGFAALMIPQGFGIIRQVFRADELGKAFGMFGPVIGGSAVLAPIIGGLLIQSDLFGTQWRSIFLVNVPIGVAALVLGFRLLPESRAGTRPTLDLAGAALVSAAVGLLVFPLIQGRESGWPAWSYAMMVTSLAFFVLFVAVERRRERHGLSPLVPMSLFRRRAFGAGLASALVFFAGLAGVMFTFSLYLQLGNGYSAIRTGLAFAPWAVGTALGAALGMSLLAPRFGRHVLHVGLGLMLVGIAIAILVINRGSNHVALDALAGPLLLTGTGMGAVLSPLFNFVLAGVPDDAVGSASGVLNGVQQLASAAGIALVGTVFFSVAALHGLTTAFGRSLWLELAALLVCALLVCMLPMQPREDAP